MKTILIIVCGLADVPERTLGGKTPLMLAHTPSLDTLARCGCCGTMRVFPEGVPITRNNAILSLLGYDFSRGIPSAEELAAFGRGRDVTAAGGLRYFVIPKFSGHGVMVSRHPEVRGIGKLALLRSLSPVNSEDGGSGLREMTDMVLTNIETEEFVVMHIESAATMSRRHDPDGKVRVIEQIDREVVRPIADYVWNAKEQMNMVVVSDCIYSWLRGMPVEGEVPAVVYFNDDLPYDTPGFDESMLEEGPLNAPLPGDLIRLLISFEPVFDDPV